MKIVELTESQCEEVRESLLESLKRHRTLITASEESADEKSCKYHLNKVSQIEALLEIVPVRDIQRDFEMRD